MAERSNGQSRKAPSLIGARGSNPSSSANVSWFESLSRSRLRPKRMAPGWGRTGRLLCQKRLGEVRRPRGKEAGFRENCRSLRLSSDHSRQRA